MDQLVSSSYLVIHNNRYSMFLMIRVNYRDNLENDLACNFTFIKIITTGSKCMYINFIPVLKYVYDI